MASVAFGLLLTLGVVLLVWAATNQVGEPPAPSGARHTVGPPAGVGSEDAGATGTAGETVAPEASGDDAGATENPGSDVMATADPTTDPTDQADTADPTPEPMAASEPVSVRIPAIGVQSPIHPLGLAADGTLEVPSGERYDEVAWYDGSPTPGETGPSVIEGHVTSQGSVPSVFFDLGALEPGDRIEVERADGSTAEFEVYGSDTFPKDEFPKATVYGNTSGPELRLITCGGDYDPDRGAHVDNVVVFASLVSDP